MNRGLFNWGVFLVAAGIVALGFRAGLFSVGAFAELGRLWPLALIALGILVLAGHVAGARVGGAVVALLFGVVVGVLIGGGAGAIGCPAPSAKRLLGTRKAHSKVPPRSPPASGAAKLRWARFAATCGPSTTAGSLATFAS